MKTVFSWFFVVVGVMVEGCVRVCIKIDKNREDVNRWATKLNKATGAHTLNLRS